MASQDKTGPRIPVAEALGLTVGEVMIAKPKTLPATVLVSDVRAVFGQPSHRTVLLTDNGVFRGSLERDRLPAEADDEPVARYAEIQPLTATPGMPIPEAVALLERQNEPRLIVLDDDGRQLADCSALAAARTDSAFGRRAGAAAGPLPFWRPSAAESRGIRPPHARVSDPGSSWVAAVLWAARPAKAVMNLITRPVLVVLACRGCGLTSLDPGVPTWRRLPIARHAIRGSRACVSF